ncbi:MAG: hypothetical protein IT267_11835 [Saprospiraceae bacterium]|nr:hypothetical protein [Saprospiraceae bacterium]
MKSNSKFSWHLFYLSLIGVIMIGSSFTGKNTLTSINSNESGAISWNEAMSMRNKYKELAPLKIEYNGQNGKQINTLEAFKISATNLLEIIQNNKSGNGYNADHVVFYLGAKDPTDGNSLPTFQLIAVGMKNNQLMIPANVNDKNDPSKSSVFDKADPCPPFCPGE